MSAELRWLRQTCEKAGRVSPAMIVTRREGALAAVWPELLAVVEAAADVAEHETRARSGGHLKPYEGHDVRTRLMRAGTVLTAAIRRSRDGAR